MATSTFINTVNGLFKQIACILIASSLLTLPAQALKIGDKAPDFTLKAMSGKNLKLAEQRGQIIVLNFWASWCLSLIHI